MRRSQKNPISQTIMKLGTSTRIIVLTSGIILWMLLGEKWEILGDGDVYLSMVNGQTVANPFGYRILIPFIVSLFPLPPILCFQVISVICLILCGYIILRFAGDYSTIPFLTSFMVIYYATTDVRVDPPALLIFGYCFYSMHRKKSIYLLMAFTSLGIFVHESIMFLIPVFFLAKIFKITEYNWQETLIFVFIVLTVFALSRVLIDVKHSTGFSYDNGLSIIGYTLDHSGGVFKHFQRIYAAFGVLWLLLFSQFMLEDRKNKLFIVSVTLINILFTFAATDTLRVVAWLYPIIFLYTGKYLASAKKNFSFTILTLQTIYSYIVFGHLRTFENSDMLKLFSILVSGLALILIIRNIKRDKGKIINEIYKSVFSGFRA